MFSDVYDRPTPALVRQQQHLFELTRLYPQDYDMSVYKQ